MNADHQHVAILKFVTVSLRLNSIIQATPGSKDNPSTTQTLAGIKKWPTKFMTPSKHENRYYKITFSNVNYAVYHLL